MTSVSSFYVNAYMQSAKLGATAAPGSVGITSQSDAEQNLQVAETTKTLGQVALDARAAIDAGYGKLGKTGNDYTTGKEWDSVVGFKDLDRRSLYAIASNQGGLFSDREMSVARSQMADRMSAVMVAADPFDLDPAKRYKAAIEFLDDASDEEKTSLAWAQDRASAQWAYQSIMKWSGQPAEDVDSGNMIVNMLLKAWDEVAARNDPSAKVENMPSWFKALELWDLENESAQPTSWSL